jgi:hypothetical protein
MCTKHNDSMTHGKNKGCCEKWKTKQISNCSIAVHRNTAFTRGREAHVNYSNTYEAMYCSKLQITVTLAQWNQFTVVTSCISIHRDEEINQAPTACTY